MTATLVTAATVATCLTAQAGADPPIVDAPEPLVATLIVTVPATFQGKPAAWWAARAVRARKDANARRAEIRRLRARLARRLQASDLDAWLCIHHREAAWNDSGDPYWGGLQMDVTFMRTYGADLIAKYGGYANLWSPADQITAARRARDGYAGYRARGYGPWPNTARACGLL